MTLALFDLDGTIISGSTGADLTVAMLKARRIGPHHAMAVAAVGLAQRLGITHGQDLLRTAATFFQGMTVAEAEGILGELYDRILKHRVYPSVRRLIVLHQAAGDTVAIISASPSMLLERFARDLGASFFLGSSQTPEDGRLPGVADEPVPYGWGKVLLARRLAADEGEDLGRASFYSDSISDLPLLEEVGHPHVINPDPRLSLTAWRRGWPITIALSGSTTTRSYR
jgi:HAD superfamily hydrolase (TIGR01490 family)